MRKNHRPLLAEKAPTQLYGAFVATIRGGWRSDGHAQQCAFGQEHTATASIRARMRADKTPIGPGKILTTSYSMLFSTFLTSNLERKSLCAAFPLGQESLTVKPLTREIREYRMTEPSHHHTSSPAQRSIRNRTYCSAPGKGRQSYGEKHRGYA